MIFVTVLPEILVLVDIANGQKVVIDGTTDSDILTELPDQGS